MTTIYNIDLVGDLTNTAGVLSGFSSSNYATLPNAFNIGSNAWEFQLKLTTGSNITSDQCLITPNNVNKDCLNVWVNSSRIIPVFVDANEQDITEFQLNCTTNTTYWLKMGYNSNKQYYAKYSTDGVNFTDISTPYTSNTVVWDTGDVWCLGIARGVNRLFNGSIDLNGCYMKINGTTVWQGVTQTAGTTIQMKRGSASRWLTVDPVLASGELGVETDTNKFKIGDGSTAWNNLDYQGIITSSDVTTALGYSPASSIPEGLNLSISSGLLTAQPGVVLSNSNNALVSSTSITTSDISTISTAQANNVILGNTSSTTTLEINSSTGTYLYGALSAQMNNYKTDMSANDKGSWLFASSSQGTNSNSWASYGFEFNTEVPVGTFNITLKSSTQDWVYVNVALWDNNGIALYQSGQKTGNISLEVTTTSPVKAITVQVVNYQSKMAPFNCNIQTTITSQDYDAYLCKDNNSLDLKLTTNPSELSSYTDYAKIGLIQYTANANPVAFPTEPLSDMFLNNRLATKPTEPNTTLVKGKSLKNIVPLAQADYTTLVNNSSIDTTTLYIITDTGAIYLGTTLIAEKN